MSKRDLSKLASVLKLTFLFCSMLSSCLHPCSKDKSEEFDIDTTLNEAELGEAHPLWEFYDVRDKECEHLCSFAFTKTQDERNFYDGNITTDSCSATIYCGDEVFEPDTGGAGCMDTAEEATVTVQCSGVAEREGVCGY